MLKKKDTSKKGRSSLRSYRSKRDFSKTPEPSKETKASQLKGPLFVIQKHAASHLHYDFRLEIDGVLVSWAIPKGPSLNPSIKRLAVRTEDHPLRYATFEGSIPQGEYGGGTVMVWDIGTFKNIKKTSLERALQTGQIEVWLEGKKLKGGFALVKMRKTKGKEFWLLVKMNDEYASKKRNPLSSQTRSALSKKTMKTLGNKEE